MKKETKNKKEWQIIKNWVDNFDDTSIDTLRLYLLKKMTESNMDNDYQGKDEKKYLKTINTDKKLIQ